MVSGVTNCGTFCANWAMLHVTEHLRDFVMGCLRQYSPLPYVCTCHQSVHAFRVHIDKVVKVSPFDVLIECSILDEASELYQHKGCNCATKYKKVCVKIFADQYHRTIKHAASMMLANVWVDMGHEIPVLHACHAQAVVIPDELVRSHAEGFFFLGELCSGGFAGWMHARQVCLKIGVDVRPAFAVECDLQTCLTYTKTWNEAFIVEDISGYQGVSNDGSYPLFATDLESGWWMTCASDVELDIMCMSTPCQPWSVASSSGGLNTREGMVTVRALISAFLLRPKILLAEQVASIRKHPHWPLVKMVIDRCGYVIVFEQVANMARVSPQQRERLLIVMVRKDAFLPSIPPEVHFPNIDMKTMISFQAIQNDLTDFQQHVKINADVLAMYLDQRFIPNVNGGKRQKLDVLAYRIRRVYEGCGCIMANYTSQHEFDETKLVEKGLYGTLLQEGDTVRFLTGMECAVLMVPCKDCFIPNDRREHMRILGNAITGVHAAFILACGLKILGVSVPEIDNPAYMVMVTMKHRLHFGNSKVIRCPEGWWLKRSEDATEMDIIENHHDMIVSSTIREDQMISVTISGGQWKLKGMCDPSVGAIQILQSFGVDENLICHAQRTVDRMFITLSKPFILPIMQLNWHRIDTKHVLILMHDGFMVLERSHCMTAQDAYEHMKSNSPCVMRNMAFVHVAGMIVHGQDPLPPIVFMIPEGIETDLRWHHELPKFNTKSGNITASLHVDKNVEFLRCLKARGISDLCHILGWNIEVCCIDKFESNSSIAFVRSLRDFVVATDAFQSMMALWVLQMLMPPHLPQTIDDVCVQIKYYGSILWKGWIQNDYSIEFITSPWNLVTVAFGVDCPIRCVCKGRRQLPEELLMNLKGDDDNLIKLHWVLPVHGGGSKDEFRFITKNKLATVLLTHGIPIADVADFVEKVLQSISPGRVMQELNNHDKPKGWENFKEWLAKNGFTVPASNNGVVKAALKIQRIVRKKKDQKSFHISASQIELVPDHFLQSDGTPAVVLKTLYGAKNGIMVMNADEAEPWVNNPNHITAENLACVVLGHMCPCTDHSKCKRISFPAKDQSGQPVVLAGCMHQLGDKCIEIPKDNMSTISVASSYVVGFTIYRDECDSKLWEVLISNPVKTVLQVIRSDVTDEFLASSPWGRSWRHGKDPATPEGASSFQFHARVKESHLKVIMGLSGKGPVYTTAKSDDKGLLDGWAIVWMKGSKNEVQIQLTAKNVEHAGVIRSMKGFGVRVAQGDFEKIFKIVRPNDKMPAAVQAKLLYRLQPLPPGASAELVESFTKEHSWPTRAIRALGATAWLVAAETESPKTWMGLNGSLVLAKPVQQSEQKPRPVVLAGSVQKQSNGVGGEKSQHDPWTNASVDPWMQFKPTTAAGSQVMKSSNTMPGSSFTASDPSLAKRLQEQDNKIQDLQKTMSDLKQGQQKAESCVINLQSDMDSKFGKIRSEVKDQMDVLSQNFHNSLSQALAKQDSQLQAGFQDLKALFVQSQEMNAQGDKRQKVVHKGKTKGKGADNENDDHDMGASPLKTGS